MKKMTTVDKLLKAAKTEFSKKGFSRTTVEDITNRAGVAKGTFYIYFDAKEDTVKFMLDEMYCSITDILDELILKLGNPQSDFAAVFKEVIMKTLQEYMNLKEVIVVVMYSDYELSKKLKLLKEQNIGKIREYIRRILELCIAHGYMRKVNVDVAASIILTLFMHFSIDVLFNENPAKLEYYVDALEDFVINGMINREQ